MSEQSSMDFGGFPHTWILPSRTLGEMVKMDLTNGDIIFGKNYTPSAAAREFWEAMGKQLRDVDEARHLGYTEGFSDGYDAGFYEGGLNDDGE